MKCYRCRRPPRELTEQNYLDDPAYHEFLAQAAAACHCTYGPCDGVLAGGPCDGLVYDDDGEWTDGE